MKRTLLIKGKYSIIIEGSTANKEDSARLVFYDHNKDKQIVITNDKIDYILNTLEKGLTNYIFTNSHFILNYKIPSLGEGFNRYSFFLGHEFEVDEPDISERYGIFNDENSLFMYYLNDSSYLEVSTIYSGNNELGKVKQDLEQWLKHEYYYITIELTKSEIHDFLSEVIDCKQEVD